MFLATIIGGTIFSLASFLSPEALGYINLLIICPVSFVIIVSFSFQTDKTVY